MLDFGQITVDMEVVALPQQRCLISRISKTLYDRIKMMFVGGDLEIEPKNLH